MPMTETELAQRCLAMGAKYPYDAPDAWWNSTDSTPPAASDWAHTAARGVLSNLRDRGGIKHAFNDIDEDVRAEIVQSLANIIRAAKPANG